MSIYGYGPDIYPEKYLKSTETKRFYYHLSRRHSKKTIILKPYIGDCWPEFESKIKRICVSITPAHCLLALPYFKTTSFNVYRTKEEIFVKYPCNVLDAEYTKEKWIIEETEFIKIDKIKISKIFPIALYYPFATKKQYQDNLKQLKVLLGLKCREIQSL
ncbi:MAG: hypothetical protein Q7R95_09105 [bacterium]|nr:hypothetical protein [bacterium]